MALSTLLYRCPHCGHDPMEGKGDEVHCPACGVRIARGKTGATLRVIDASGESIAPAATLTRAIATVGGPRPEGGSDLDLAQVLGDATVIHEASVTRSRSIAEEPVHHRGRLLGFAERQGEGENGRIVLTEEHVVFLVGDEVRDRWPLLDLLALQSSSSLVQLSIPGDTLIQFRFHTDSPRRWEDLLRLALQQAFDRAGRGTILEFQPRIVTR